MNTSHVHISNTGTHATHVASLAGKANTTRLVRKNTNPPKQSATRGCGHGHRGADPDRLEDSISLGSFSLTDAAKGPTPIPNAAEAHLATSPALSQNKKATTGLV
jgi:hypothetical protein